MLNFVDLSFLTFKARLAFIKWKQLFIKALIFYYFDLKQYIRIEIDISSYAISRILGDITLNNLSQ